MSIHYSRRRVLLHWLSAVIILWALASGFYVAFNPVPASTEQWVGSLNVSLTTLFIPFFVWRAWLFFYELEPRGTALSGSKRLASAVHALIYLVIGVVLVTGVLMMKSAISVFGLVRFPQPLADPTLIELANTVHTLSCVVLSMLVALHLCAVLWHEFSGRRVVRRMSFAKPAGTLERAQR
ncbi:MULTISPECIES: cytochrome b [Pseudomonas]|jgi:cytochrome b561|uniref:Cytochrome B n=1 Tax=Pseudomonas bijieensis TaxID=2681983 RepID=A0A6N1CG58_9PSED|nr:MULTISPECIES: cytochrome b/b6 domain-containing protein [Pseudomonas]QIB05422.1 cytochrome B [Pseudomonas fluorescens]QKS83350.1 cytochrome B [Pseudomonas bijieensis]UQI31638.1 cytochrome b/b6 domain-containing protein [Pseudomonas bijieensis]WLH63427.1 cytochrome b/b6 domain-containing protein [Pseudomonas sp. FP2300]